MFHRLGIALEGDGRGMFVCKDGDLGDLGILVVDGGLSEEIDGNREGAFGVL